MLKLYKQRLTHKFTTAYGFSEPFIDSPKPTVENLWIMKEFFMKKSSHIFMITFITVLFYSCQSYPENKGKLTVSNFSENENDKITAVYTRLYGTESWILQWQSSEGKGVQEDAVMYLVQDKYDVLVYVCRENFFNYYELLTFETGYKNPVEITESNYTIIAFDGKGIYKM